MNSHLCISVTFLDPLFHGKGDNSPEWPPSPMRLFQALLAGARTGCREDEWSAAKAEAFLWLEGLPPPLIVAPKAQFLSGYEFFVPNNDSDREPDRQKRLTSKNARPHWLSDGVTVHYLWAVDTSGLTDRHSRAQLLCHEARFLLALGWGIDQVIGSGRILTDSEVVALPGHRWRTWTSHRPEAPAWRVPTVGSLDNLERVHQSFLQQLKGRQYQPPLKLASFERVVYISDNTLPPRSYSVFELPEGVAFRQEDTIKVAAMLRSLASRSAREDTHEFPGGSETYVAGHIGHADTTPPRFSYLPLPTIGQDHSDGMIRRLLISEPLGGDGAHARWAQNRLRTATLRDQDGNERGVLLDPWRKPSRSIIERYVSGARAWCTVTPLVLPGFDDGKHAKAEKLLLSAICQADISPSALAGVTMRKAPFWPGSHHPSQYAVPDYLRQLPAWHVRLVFRESVPGPLAIGAGRHVGLGLFARAEE